MVYILPAAKTLKLFSLLGLSVETAKPAILLTYSLIKNTNLDLPYFLDPLQNRFNSEDSENEAVDDENITAYLNELERLAN